MRAKEDIGKLIKERLDSIEGTTTSSLWDRIDNSLEERRKKRRFAFWLSSMGIAGLLLLSIFFFNNTGSELTEQPKITVEESINKNEGSSTLSPIKNDTLNYDYSILDDEFEGVLVEDNVSEIIKDGEANFQESSEMDVTATKTTSSRKDEVNSVRTDLQKIKSSAASFDSVTDGAEVKTTYYYYRGEDNSQVVTSDKAIIDSLIANNKEAVKDSIN